MYALLFALCALIPMSHAIVWAYERTTPHVRRARARRRARAFLSRSVPLVGSEAARMHGGH